MSFHMENRSKGPEGKGRAAGGRCHRPGEMKESWPKRRSKEMGGLQTAQRWAQEPCVTMSFIDMRRVRGAMVGGRGRNSVAAFWKCSL